MKKQPKEKKRKYLIVQLEVTDLSEEEVEDLAYFMVIQGEDTVAEEAGFAATYEIRDEKVINRE
jgi:hypothetical protein